MVETRSAPPARRSALPARRTRLIGRDAELEAIRERVLHGDRRLVTLSGAGGTGKTTLALETARLLDDDLPDGAWFVDLAIVREARVDAVALAASGALGLLDQETPPLEALTGHLATRQALLVLDNCEHLLAAVSVIVDAALDKCPDLRILATSRAPLHVRDESVYVVPPFEVPSPAVAADPDRLATVEAVQLFVERATAVDPSFRLSAATAPAVASICRRLDGIPLAIELAAAGASVLTPLEIDERLMATGEAVSIPTDGHGPERQRTMDATLDWSHDLLDPPAQGLFRRLSVFAGGWTLDAAEQVGSLGIDPGSVMPLLSRLVDHSLVVRDEEGARSRYRMLAPIAEYAARRLAAEDEVGPASMAHAMYYLKLSSRPPDKLAEAYPEELDLIAADHDNCLAAIRFAEGAGILPLRFGLIANLLMLWRARGQLHRATAILTAALADAAAGSYERGMVLGVLSEFGHLLGDYDGAERQAREAEAIFTVLGDPIALRACIGQLGLIAAGRGDFATARAEYVRARPLVDQLPGDSILGYWHAGMGRFEQGLGNTETARVHLEAADEHFRRAPSWYHGRVLTELGVIARSNGEPVRAAALLAEALDSLDRYHATVDALTCLEEMARLAIDQRDPRRAATLLAAATGLRDATGAQPSVPERKQLDADIDGVRLALTPREFEAAWGRGLGLGLEQVAVFARSASGDVGTSAVTAPPRGSALTPREREIAEMVALGLTNREIADRLVIAPGTVKVHVERILGKLGRTSRVQVATWAAEGRERTRETPAAG